MSSKRITSITIDNICGHERLVVEPGAVTVVTGRNGAGKTSLLSAIRAAFLGGHDASLLRKGASKGRVAVTLDDGTEVVKTITAEKSTVTVSQPETGKISRAQAYIDKSVDPLGLDPLALLHCPDSKRAEYLEEVAAPQVADADLQEASGRAPAPAKPHESGLDRIDALRGLLYDERTGINRIAKDKRATVAQLRETLPPAADGAPDVAELRARKDELEAARAEKRAAAKARTARELDAARDDADLAIAAIRREAEERIGRIKDSQAKNAATLQAEEQAAIEALAAEVEPQLEALAADIARADQIAREQARAERTREIIEESERAAKAAEARALELSAAIANLDALREKTVSSIPVPGLELRDGKVYVDGVAFDRVNTARQIEIAVQVAKLRAGPLGVLVVDHGEALDKARFDALVEAAAASDLQVIVSRVSDEDLDISVPPGAIPAASTEPRFLPA